MKTNRDTISLPFCLHNGFLLLFFHIFLFPSCTRDYPEIRKEISLNNNWKSIVNDSNPNAYKASFDDSEWHSVDVPHNWDKYHGYLRKLHGNLHGYAWYRKNFSLEKSPEKKRYFLFFEGVGSYATIWVNGKQVGYHAGGRTTFTLDITDVVVFDSTNILAVRADHPENIRNLPWVCGGCSDEWGFSEGSQPLGIFRPVTLIITNDVRIEPFGVHIWNDTTVSNENASLWFTSEINNYSSETKKIILVSTLLSKSGKKIAKIKRNYQIGPGSVVVLKDSIQNIKNPHLWSPEKPYLYTLKSEIFEGNKEIDDISTSYGIRKISWPIYRADSSNQFLINGKPVFINGIGEYEHMIGNSHAFSDEQIKTRVEMIKAAGFNAFRDAHQPHNSRYQNYWDQEGILWWTQMSAHIWFDNPEFRENFKNLLRDWVKERRNNPGNIMWGLQNESTLPYEFARECVEIIREMDPTCPSQRLVSTCNGGTGTDWNVIQNWSGTYGGNPKNYDKELSTQLLNGEYGAWRSIDLHSEGPFNQQGILSEDRMVQLLEMKVKLAESVKEKTCGQFVWILNSHDNPGRIQNGEGLRDIDRIGPLNYKGLFTSWGEPLDVFYMYRANYVSSDKSPMVYIASHTWPNRWLNREIKDSITVYSNCDEVELFNDTRSVSLGRLKNKGLGKPFIWTRAEINYNVLLAKGYCDGEEVASDIIILDYLPESPHFTDLLEKSDDLLKPEIGYNYIYRMNCGGPDYIDKNGNTWTADRPKTSENGFGSKSWTNSFNKIPSFYGSQRRTFDPISGTNDWKLFQTFRYGLDQLSFNFPVPDGEYLVELYFSEPWYGTGGGLDCKGWRLFDVAINDSIVLKSFDIWSESGHDKALKKSFTVHVNQGEINVHFPKALSGQAVISAITIAGKENINISQVTINEIGKLQIFNPDEEKRWKIKSWLDIGDYQYSDTNIRFFELPSLLFGVEWIKCPATLKNSGDVASLKLNNNSNVFVSLPPNTSQVPKWMNGFAHTPLTLKTNDGKVHNIYNKQFKKDESVLFGNIDIDGKSTGGYSVFIVPESFLEAPTDQRQLKEYSSELAILKRNIGIKKIVNNRHFIEITSNSTEEIEWQFLVGLASTYGIHFKYMNDNDLPFFVEMSIKTSDGIEMHKEKLKLKPGSNWQTLKTNTGTTLNAGTYRVILKITNSKGLLLQRMEVQ